MHFFLTSCNLIVSLHHNLRWLIFLFTYIMIVLFYVLEPPDPPSKIEVKCESEADKDNPEVTRIMAEVFWQPGRDHYAPILYYKLQYNTSFSADTWYDVSLPRPKPKVNTTKPYVDPLPGILPNATRYDILLSPFGNYTFRVLARNKVGYSKPSQHTTMMCTTEADVPYKNPENVIAEGDRPGNMVIFWTVSFFSVSKISKIINYTEIIGKLH